MNFWFRLRWPLLLVLFPAAWLLWPHFEDALAVDNRLTIWFVEDDPALQTYQQFQKVFGNDEVVAVHYTPGQSIWQHNSIRNSRRLSAELNALAAVADVRSLNSLQLPSRNAFSSLSRPLISPQGNIDTGKVRQYLRRHPFLEQQFTGDSDSGLMHIVALKPASELTGGRKEAIDAIRRKADEVLGAEHYQLGGVGVIYAALNDLSKRDFSRFFGVGYSLMFLLLWLIYRRILIVFYALSTIALASFFTLAIYGLAGLQLNLMTVLLPAIIILLCVMDVMHIVNQHARINQDEAGAAPRQKSLKSLTTVWRPCLFTTLTTMAGFLALLASPIAILRQFGIYAALGIFLGLVFSFLLGLFFLPALKRMRRGERTSQWLLRWSQKVVAHRRLALGLTTVLLLLFAAGIFQLSLDTNTLAYLPEDHPVVKDHEQIEGIYGPYLPLDYMVSARDTISMLKHSGQLLTFQDSVVSQLPLEAGLGFPQLLRLGVRERYGESWQEQMEKSSVLRITNQKVEQLYPRLHRAYLSEEEQLVRISFKSKLVSAGELEQRLSDIEQWQKEMLPDELQLRVTGFQGLYANIINYVTESLLRSLGWAILIIFILLVLFLQDLKLAALSLLPNFFPVLAMLGFMGLFGIQLDTATASIATIVISFSIDDTMHFIYHYQKLRRKKFSSAEARAKTMALVGRAILFTSAVLFTGYILMVFGSLQTVIYFGLLTAVSILAALYAQMVIFPNLLARFDR